MNSVLSHDPRRWTERLGVWLARRHVRWLQDVAADLESSLARSRQEGVRLQQELHESRRYAHRMEQTCADLSRRSALAETGCGVETLATLYPRGLPPSKVVPLSHKGGKA